MIFTKGDERRLNAIRKILKNYIEPDIPDNIINKLKRKYYKYKGKYLEMKSTTEVITDHF